MKITLPVWANRGEIKKLKLVFEQWWSKVEGWLALPLAQINPDTCGLIALNLLAWQRGITRMLDEPESLYRRRVKFAFVNAKDAGSVAGIQRIFERLGIGYVEVTERAPGKDWDVIILQLSDGQLSQNQNLLRLLLRTYGRTCRRYEFNLIQPVSLGVSAESIPHTFYYTFAS
ncbi:phage tail protein [Marinibactrum halimedae]|uniref:Phage tail protein n=1 Tax=Marinibactrum halimedae TaxID=1444977 RepID=A0AA37T3L3_9GAMM|nr:phage tail protein [Marinibactrum halimedae]MCD9458456.1 phage tail protein [Marinibactrum halimedae]GLS26153.1 phage tail protein [Marinibactrum halimedae]